MIRGHISSQIQLLFLYLFFSRGTWRLMLFEWRVWFQAFCFHYVEKLRPFMNIKPCFTHHVNTLAFLFLNINK